MTDGFFSLILFFLVLLSGAVTLLDIFWLSKKRELLADASVNTSESESSQITDSNQKITNDTGWIATIRSVFPVLLIVFVLRTFLYAPFKIPSGSMIPTLKIGNHILVSKYAYGLKFPYFGTKLLSLGSPQRGDIVVFRSTSEFSRQNDGKKEDLIKRLVGMPGDHIRYEHKNLYINNQLVSKDFVQSKPGMYESSLKGIYPFDIYKQSLDTQNYEIQNYPDVSTTSGEWTVPQGMYFMMGDNRDLSDDSRYWGFVPEKNIIGKAVLVWMHWTSWKTLPSFKDDRMLYTKG